MLRKLIKFTVRERVLFEKSKLRSHLVLDELIGGEAENRISRCAHYCTWPERSQREYWEEEDSSPIQKMQSVVPKPNHLGVPVSELTRTNGTVHKMPQDWNWLGKFGPRFGVDGSKVKILKNPTEFYEALIDQIVKSQKRIYLASLYLGTGEKEKKLVDHLYERLDEYPRVSLNILLDHSRGSRGSVSSRSMLSPLLKFPKCNIYLYHTPRLRGMVKKFLPQRWNEILGVQHIKVYLFDNNLILSGANLSNDYFTDRQDRYLLIEDCKDLADFNANLVDEISKLSFVLDRKGNTVLHPDCAFHPSEGDKDLFVSHASKSILKFYNEYKTKFNAPEKCASSDYDTWIFPMIQMGPLSIDVDEQATNYLFEKAPKDSEIKLATGYFNLTRSYIQNIVYKSFANFDILMAHPKANGFFGAKGFARGIPDAYTLLATQFFDKVRSKGQDKRIKLREYLKPSWTFHAKGLWLYEPTQNTPSLTLIGSPNFGHRSAYRDLEAQMYLATINPNLRNKLKEEQEYIYKLSEPFDKKVLNSKDRAVPLWVRAVILVFRNFF